MYSYCVGFGLSSLFFLLKHVNFLCRYREMTNVYVQKSIISKQRRQLTQQNNLFATMMGDNKFKYCDEKCFRLSPDCNGHELTHSGLKLYQCKYCDKCFNYPSKCKQHEVLHNGVKPYQCKYCDKCFNCSSNCKRHEVLHNGVKPY